LREKVKYPAAGRKTIANPMIIGETARDTDWKSEEFLIPTICCRTVNLTRQSNPEAAGEPDRLE